MAKTLTAMALDAIDLIGLRIKRRRKELGMNQPDLAKKADVSVSYLSRLESGKVPDPSFRKVVRLASNLDCRISDIYQEAVTEEDTVNWEYERMLVDPQVIATNPPLPPDPDLDTKKHVLAIYKSLRRLEQDIAEPPASQEGRPPAGAGSTEAPASSTAEIDV